MERDWLRRLALSAPGAREAGRFVFLADPAWGSRERAALEAALAAAATVAENTDDADDGWLCIPTGGTSGRVKFARHDERTVTAAIDGYRAHFAMPKVNAVGVLPLHHVSGFMAAARCLYSGGRYISAPWKALHAGERPRMDAAAGPWVLSLVPTQLQRLLSVAGGAAWLRRFAVVHVGGGPVWPALAEAAAAEGVSVALGYGMTETAAMVVSQRPSDFARGRRDAGHVMPHASVELVAEGGAAQSDKAADEEGGRIILRGASLFRGYFPDTRGNDVLITDDVGHFSPEGTLHLLGRRDAVIITGGKKVWPEEVEAVLHSTGVFPAVAVLGVPSAEWGQEVVACYAGSQGLSVAQRATVEAALNAGLARFKHPKRFVPIDPWPTNEQGKVNRARLAEAEGLKG